MIYLTFLPQAALLIHFLRLFLSNLILWRQTLPYLYCQCKNLASLQIQHIRPWCNLGLKEFKEGSILLLELPPKLNLAALQKWSQYQKQ